MSSTVPIGHGSFCPRQMGAMIVAWTPKVWAKIEAMGVRMDRKSMEHNHPNTSSVGFEPIVVL